jgi:hypothetical protein
MSFNNVEVAVHEKIGLEPTTYIRNIDKDYVSYTSDLETQHAATRSKKSTSPPPSGGQPKRLSA